MKSIVALFVFAVFFTAMGGCVSPVKRVQEFNESEYAGRDRDGTGTLVGQAFLRAANGDVKYGAGCEVWLNPVTSYSTEWFEKGVVPNHPIVEGDPRADKYRRTVIADGEGRFKFERLPAGDYYAVCIINWFVTQYRMTGGPAFAKVTVREGQTTEAILHR